MGESRIEPLSVEHLLQIRAHYRSLVATPMFREFPKKSNWIRWGYLDSSTMTKLGSVEFGDSITIRIHPKAFEFESDVLVLGIVRHELLHVLLGPEEGHGALFTSLESSWEHFQRYHHHKRRFFRLLRLMPSDVGGEISYECPNCNGMVHTNAPLSPDSACRECCKAFNKGKWCETYVLIKVG